MQEKEDGLIEIAAVSPMASMQAVINKNLIGIADEVGEKLKTVVNSLR